jgi:hypothetical protein
MFVPPFNGYWTRCPEIRKHFRARRAGFDSAIEVAEKRTSTAPCGRGSELAIYGINASRSRDQRKRPAVIVFQRPLLRVGQGRIARFDAGQQPRERIMVE